MNRHDIEDAYIRLKRYSYFEKHNPHLWYTLALAEERGLKSIYDTFLRSLSSEEKWGAYIEKHLQSICLRYSIKRFQTGNVEIKTNSSNSSGGRIERYQVFFDGSFELWLVGAVWLQLFGMRLEWEIGPQNFGNRLVSHGSGFYDQLTKRRVFYRSYPHMYQRYRQGAVDAALGAHKKGKSVALISTDIEDFYSSVKVNLSELREAIGFERLTVSESRVHKAFEGILRRFATLRGADAESPCLPIGFPPSGVLANWYLREFDNAVMRQRPIHYARYVDDIIVVDTGVAGLRSRKGKADDKNAILSKVFGSILSCGEEGARIAVKGLDHLKLNWQKTKVHVLFGEHSAAGLRSWAEMIAEESSEMRILPDEESLTKGFDKSIFRVLYKDSPHSFSSLEEFAHDRYRVSLALSKFLQAMKWSLLSNGKSKDFSAQLKRFLRGDYILLNMDLVEKAIGVYFLREDWTAVSQLWNESMKSIERLLWVGSETAFAVDVIRESLKRNLMLRISRVFALNLAALSNLNSVPPVELREMEKIGGMLRNANLIPHHMVRRPLANYLQVLPGDLSDKSAVLGELQKARLKYSPRELKMDEIQSYLMLRGLSGRMVNGSDLYMEALKIRKEVDKEIDDKFVRGKGATDRYGRTILNLRTEVALSERIVQKATIRCFDVRDNDDNLLGETIKQEQKLKTEGEETTYKFRVGIPNWNGPKDAQEYRPSDQIGQRLVRILNEAKQTKVQIVVFPELSIPDDWVPFIGEFCRREGIGCLMGLTYSMDRSQVKSNRSVALLPFCEGQEQSIVYIHREKNYYSPHESALARRKKWNLKPEKETPIYDVFKWKDVVFTYFNCIELANIRDRSLFGGRVDVLFAVERNPDTDYFSNIVEATARDLHCYCVQVNDALYGDSRIFAPFAKRYQRDVARFKGTEIMFASATLWVDTLRREQLNAQRGVKSKIFKPLPPGFTPDRFLS